MVTPRSVHAFKLLLTAWFIVSHTEAFRLIQGEPNDFTVKEARCYANCFTLHASYNNDSEKICETAACQECLHPCGKGFSDDRDCINRFCSNSTACNASCRFLTVLNSLSSSALRDGDGSKPMQPGKPNVTDMNITSVSLQWTPVSNTSETPVYVIGWRYSGDASTIYPFYFSQILTTPRATLTVEQLCTLTLFSRLGRSSFNGVNYTFQIAVLTENSSLSFGPYSTAIIFPKPKQVTNVTVTSFEYDARQIATRRIALNASWIQPDEEKHIISKYAMFWDDIGPCTQETPQTAETTGPQPNGTIFFNEDLLKCTHTLKVYAMAGCTASDPTTITYEYPGCLNITDFPRDVCSRVEPLASSPEDRQVSNISYRIVAVNDDYNFNVSITWEPPAYNFRKVTSYFLLWFDSVSGSFLGPSDSGSSKDPRQLLVNVPPALNYTVSITAYFEDDTAEIFCKVNIINFSTPGPSSEETVVQNLVVGAFIEDDKNITYSVQFKWEHPLLNKSRVVNYNIAYKLSGYSRDDLPCRPTSCSMMVNETFFDIPDILPRESIHLEVTPVYLNQYIKGQMRETDVTAPEPREELIKVVGLKNTNLVSNGNSTFRATVKWQKPLFTHSDIQYYSYNISVTPNKNVQERRRRATETEIRKTTSNTNVTIDGIEEDVEYTFKVKPVFTVEVLSGRDATLAIFKDPPVVPTPKASSKLTAGEVGGLVVGLLLLILIALCLVVWCYRTSRQKRGLRDNGLLGSRNEWMIDDWEVDGGMVSLDKEVGEGAFGKVYQGFLQKLPASSRQLSFKPTMDSTRKSTMKQSDGLTVAVKMLHNMADTDQRREFLEEIQLMKDVGCHRNIINMIGCCTIEEPMFLLVEYVPYGDLLHYLRKHRGKLKDYLGDDSRGAYRSTYCETYFTDATSGGISVKATKSDRLYVNTPEMQKEDNGNIQILSFKSSNSAGETGAGNNRGSTGDVFYVNSLAIQEGENDSQESTEAEANAEEEEDDESEQTLTPGDLMAFAWQISQGMEYLAKKGFIHRDLAARNVLVGEKKIAKVADFGLTRHVYEEKVYHAKHNRKLPLKWMSIEAVFDETFTSQSDVWAFGIVLWELVTLGGTPYPSINNRELLKLLKEGYRMEKPEICNDEFYDLMTDCWKEIPTERPTFALIRARMEEMMQKDNPYLDFSALDESKEYYQVASFNSLMEESTDDELSSKTDEDLLNMEGELMSEESLEDSNLSESMKKLEDKKIRETFDRVKDLTIKNNHCRIDAEDPKDAQITMNDIEMNLYRPGKRGLVL